MILAACAVTLMVPVCTHAQRQGFAFQSTRSVGMGGAGVALAGPDNAVFLNPALLGASDRTHFRLFEVQALVNSNTFEHYNFYSDHSAQFEALDDMSDPDRNRFYYEMLEVARDETVFGFSGMAPLSIVGPGYSFGFYERAVVNYDLREGASSVPLIQATAVAEAELVVGVGRNVATFFGRDVCLGANGKYLYRAVVSESRTAPAVDNFENIRVYKGSAFAFDLGILVVGERWSFGGGFYDVNWPEFDWRVDEALPEGFASPRSGIDGSMRLGVAHNASFGIPGLVDRFKFAFDVESPLSDEMGTFKKVSLGSEFRFANLVMVRAGLHQGYPSAGAGVMLKMVRVEYAFTGEALGRYPGQLDSWNHYVSVGLGWGY
jgi:hypothetical protein